MKPALQRKTFGSRGLAVRLWKLSREEHGDEHPAARAALGRLLWYRGNVPQRDAVSPEAVAWHRESGAIPGYLNKAHRKALRIAVDNPSTGTTEEA